MADGDLKGDFERRRLAACDSGAAAVASSGTQAKVFPELTAMLLRPSRRGGST